MSQHNEHLYAAFRQQTGGYVTLSLHPFLALAILALCRHGIGHPQVSAHAQSAVWHWCELVSQRFDAVTPGITGLLAPARLPSTPWEVN